VLDTQPIKSLTGQRQSGCYDRCTSCDEPLWKGRCARSRCPENSDRHLRRQAQRVKMNLQGFKGEVVMLTLTAPGRDKLPYGLVFRDDGQVALSELVDDRVAAEWNRAGMWRAWRELRERAAQYAHRQVKGQRNGLLAAVPERQKRGVLHLHCVLGAETLLERRWCEAFGKYCRRHAYEHGLGKQADLGKRWTRGTEVTGYVGKLARYVTKANALRGLWENGELPGRAFYVSRRLTGETGCTMRMLRRRGAAWGSWRLSVPERLLTTWWEFERALGRDLTYRELAALVNDATKPNAPPAGLALAA
jgi:hypothetical protein